MSSMTQLRHRVLVWQRYRRRTGEISLGQLRAQARVNRERSRRREIAERRWWPR